MGAHCCNEVLVRTARGLEYILFVARASISTHGPEENVIELPEPLTVGGLNWRKRQRRTSLERVVDPIGSSSQWLVELDWICSGHGALLSRSNYEQIHSSPRAVLTR